MSASLLQQRYAGLIFDLGKGVAHSLYPDDIEYYFMALELVDSSGKMVDYFAFPILPKNYSESMPEITSVKKTMGGITTLKTTTFIPTDITLSGNFGRRFRITVGGRVVEGAAITLDNLSAKRSPTYRDVPELSSSIKNGYGALKKLEKILKKSKSLDDKDLPYKLFFYNSALNHNYLVEHMFFNPTQSIESNMIWDYTLQLKAIAPLDAVDSLNPQSLLNAVALNTINRNVNAIGNRIARVLLNGGVDSRGQSSIGSLFDRSEFATESLVPYIPNSQGGL